MAPFRGLPYTVGFTGSLDCRIGDIPPSAPEPAAGKRVPVFFYPKQGLIMTKFSWIPLVKGKPS
jgi:hypothetical protein